jgi:hypothetical protein
MPKGQITEDDLASGLKGLGGFGSLGGPQKLRRDSPFRDSSVEPKTVELAPRAEPIVSVVEPEVPPTSTSASGPESKPVVEQIRPPRAVRAKQVVAAPAAPKDSGQRKADIFTERVTLQMSPQMRDAVSALARALQRAKTTTDERITANTVMRVAVQLLIDHFEVRPGESANTEETLYALALEKLKIR